MGFVGYCWVLAGKVTGKVAERAISNFLSYLDSENAFALRSRQANFLEHFGGVVPGYHNNLKGFA